MKASDLFVQCLEEEGVEYVFGVPGEENLDLLESLRTSNIRVIVTRHEQHAAFMSATYGRLTGRTGVCLSTLGPGATNLVTGIAYAQLGGMPLLAITGQKPIRNNWQGQFQLINIVDMFHPITKWNKSVVSANTIPTDIRHAFKIAEQERPGAVHIELPEDIASDSVEQLSPHTRVKLRRPVADDRGINLACELIASARCPIIILSSGANRKRVGKQLKAFVEATGIYAVSTQTGKGVLPDDHPQSLFCLGIHKHDYVHSAIDTADLVITVGYDIVEYPPHVWNENHDKRVLHIDFEAAEPDPSYNPDLELVGDISYSLWALHTQLKNPAFKNGHMAEMRKRIDEKLHHELPEPSFPPSPRQIVKQVRNVMGREDIISLDNGIYKIWFARMYQAYTENTVLLDNALATMGAGLGAAMAAKIVHPDRRAMAICGDGGFMMNSQDMETAVRLKMDLVVLLLRDGGFGFIRWKQENEGFEDFSMDFGNPDFVKYAESYGAKALRLEQGQDLERLLEQAFALGGVVLVDCAIDYADNSILNQDLRLDMQDLVQ